MYCISLLNSLNLKNKNEFNAKNENSSLQYNQGNQGNFGQYSQSQSQSGMSNGSYSSGSSYSSSYGPIGLNKEGQQHYQNTVLNQNQNQNYNPIGLNKEGQQHYQNTVLNQNQNSDNGNKYWEKLFGVKSERPKSICDVDVAPKNNPNNPNNPNNQNGAGSEASLPFKKKNYRYNKPGFEDSAYLWDYLDELLRDKIVSAFKNIWEKVAKTNSDQKINNPYSLKNMLKYYAANGAANEISFDIDKENDTSKMIDILKKFNKGISMEETLYGVKLDQLNQALQSFGLPAPSKSEALKILIDRYDFNGDGVLSKEEFLYMIIVEAKDKLNDKNLFSEICSSILDPMFEFFDCNHDGFITAEGIWNGLRDLKRSNSNEYNMYSCLSKEGKQPVRTTAVNDMVIKHMGIKTGALNQNEWRKAVLLGYWDRQVNGMKIFDKDENNKKESRWINKEKDKECDNL